LEGRGRWISEFEASLIYKVNSRTARATQRNLVSKNQKKKKKKKKRKERLILAHSFRGLEKHVTVPPYFMEESER
jgi:hypothetical protein